VKEKGNKHAWD